jgi:hypothetical protein
MASVLGRAKEDGAERRDCSPIVRPEEAPPQDERQARVVTSSKRAPSCFASVAFMALKASPNPPPVTSVR